jgi:hypothetical protein
LKHKEKYKSCIGALRRSNSRHQEGGLNDNNVFRELSSDGPSALRGQFTVLLTCWLKKAKLFPIGIPKNMLVISSGISELGSATTKTDRTERSI